MLSKTKSVTGPVRSVPAKSSISKDDDGQKSQSDRENDERR